MSVFASRDVGNAFANDVEFFVFVAKQNISCTQFINLHHLHIVLVIELNSYLSQE